MTDSRLTVLVPMRIEAVALAGSLRGARVVCTGMWSAGTMPELDGPGPVAVAGLCGGLDRRIRVGDIVVASELRPVVGAPIPCPSAGILAAAVRRAGLRVHVGPIRGVDGIVRGDERRALAETGAVAIDMESVELAAGSRSRPLAVMRAVSDTAGQESFVRGGARALAALRRAAPALLEWAAIVDNTREVWA